MDFIIFENELKCLMLAFLHFDTDYYPNQTESLFCCIPFRKAKENCLYKVGFIQKKKKDKFCIYSVIYFVKCAVLFESIAISPSFSFVLDKAIITPDCYMAWEHQEDC